MVGVKMSKLLSVRLLKGIFRLANPKIWIASVIPMLLGGAAAYKESGQFNWYWFLVSIAGIFLIEIGKHAINEAVDYVTGVDRFVAPDKQTPFSGGRRTIVDGTLSFLEVSIVGLLTMGAAAMVGLYVVFFREPSVIWIGLAGFLIAAFYTLPPMKFIYNGLGEIAVGVTYGPLIVMGTFLVQTHTLALFPLLISIPVGFLITNVLWINQFPDYEADKQGNKRNWVVRLGKKRSLNVFAALFTISYLYIIFLAMYIHKPLLLIPILSVPVAVYSVKVAFRNYNDIPKLIKANAGTIQVYMLTGLLLAVSVLMVKL
jgi:1,4-dihydroxy-2-naphthoate octaprenyltransferase